MNWVKLSCKSRTLMCYFKSPVTILWPWQSSKDSNPISISVEHTFSLPYLIELFSVFITHKHRS